MFAENLFDWASNSKNTSQEAYEKIEPGLKDSHIKIIQTVFRSPDGLTPDEYADDYLDGNFSYSRPRFTELYKMGLIELCEWRRANKKGNNCRCYKLTKLGYRFYLKTRLPSVHKSVYS
jgi:hypothetical protein